MKYISRRHEILFYVKSGYLRKSRLPLINLPIPCLLFQRPLSNTSICNIIHFTFVRRRNVFGIIRV
jgi:hypothetical protein